MFCYFVSVMPYMMVLARRVGAETQLQRVTAGWCNQLMWETVDSKVLELCSKHWSLHRWCFLIMTSRLCHVWLCDVASPIPSWHRLRRGGVTFQWLAVFCCGLRLDVVCCELGLDVICYKLVFYICWMRTYFTYLLWWLILHVGLF